MHIQDMQKRALEIRNKYRILETKKTGKPWNNIDLARGFLKDVTDLLQLIKNKDSKEKISHELSDCLWSVLVLANNLQIDIEDSFVTNMDALSDRIEAETD